MAPEVNRRFRGFFLPILDTVQGGQASRLRTFEKAQLFLGKISDTEGISAAASGVYPQTEWQKLDTTE